MLGDYCKFLTIMLPNYNYVNNDIIAIMLHNCFVSTQNVPIPT